MPSLLFSAPARLLALSLALLISLSAADRPNILWLTSEDHGPEMGCYGDANARTPNIDALAAQGMIFKKAWSNHPVCAPARTTIATGFYGESSGAIHMRSMVPLAAGAKLYPDHLREAGYYTTNNAKEDYNVPKSAQTWHVSSKQAHWKDRAAGQPFFAVFNSEKSHESQIRTRPHNAIADPAKMRVPAYHPDVRVWEVRDSAGAVVGLWYFDPFARKGKQSGAWMSGYRSQEDFDDAVPAIVSNNCNFTKPLAGEPALISWDDATTLFHEFGHALHGLCSRVKYPSVSGTNVANDYVEFPSQVLEHWLSTPEVLDRFALHHATGRPIPRELAAKIEHAATFNAGFKTVEFLASALIDMKLHLLKLNLVNLDVAGAAPIDPARFERDTLSSLGMPDEIVMRHRTPQFGHIFSGDGYSAGYYSYLWADTLTADAWEAFTEAGGPWDEAVAKRLHAHVFSVGNTIDPADGYRAFRGRDARIGALMRKRGFSA